MRLLTLQGYFLEPQQPILDLKASLAYKSFVANGVVCFARSRSAAHILHSQALILRKNYISASSHKRGPAEVVVVAGGLAVSPGSCQRPPAEAGILRGLKSLRELSPLLNAFAQSCGHVGSIHELTQQLIRPNGIRRRPILLLVAKEGSLLRAPARISPAHLAGVVILSEYVLGPRLGLQVFSSADEDGKMNVIAPCGTRARIAAIAATTLVQNGAQLVQVLFSDIDADHRSPVWTPTSLPALNLDEIAESLGQIGKPRGRWAVENRPNRLYLPLLGSSEETLMRMSKKTRFNLRYYRRRIERDYGCEVVPDAPIERADFLAFSQTMFKPVTPLIAQQRWASLRANSNASLLGIRDHAGGWLSLICVIHHERFARIDWLMNRAEIPYSSIANVARACVMDYEIARGSTRLYIRGGTNHPSGRSYLEENVSQLTLQRATVYAEGVSRIGRFLQPAHPPDSDPCSKEPALVCVVSRRQEGSDLRTADP